MELYPTVAAVGGISLENHCILFFSNNQAVVEIINKSSSKDPNIMIHVRCLTLTAMKLTSCFELSIYLVYIILQQTFYPVFSSKRQGDMLHGFRKQPR